MRAANGQPRGGALTRRIAGLWMVVLAFGLAVVGIFMALEHARSVTYRLMAQTEAQASRIADNASERFRQQLINALTTAAQRLLEAEKQQGEPRNGWPQWIDGIFGWDGGDVRVLVAASRDTEPLAALFKALMAERGPTQFSTPGQPQILRTAVRDRPLVLGWMLLNNPSGRRIAVAAGINLVRLKSELVEPLLSTYAELELVSAGDTDRPWSQPLYGALRSWSIQPTEAFLREQRNTVLGQALISSGLSIVALGTLLAAMWILVRAMRREMAVARMKANFVADVSHELKTPLALIRMFGETLQSGRVASEEKRREYYRIITRESIRLTNLINNILDFAQIEAGRSAYSLEPIPIAEVVRETYEAYRAQLDQNGFEHHLTVGRSLPAVNADRDAMVQALINLINNAVKYSGDERYLAIDVASDVRRDRRGVLISVHDRGIGIRPEERARVFDGFFRASDGRVREQRGTGLGLALVKHIVDAHGGSLDVESRLVKGSTFRIFLPASTPTDAGNGSPAQENLKGA